MAATRLIALHVNKGKTVAQCLADRTDYSQNAAKTNDGEFISSYECDPKTADEEFLLSKRQYQHITGRQQKNNIIAYQIRQSFKPGEITPEEANQVGYETAMRWTKGKHAFIVATHIDKSHIHNHIIYNSTSLDATRKFKNFFLSGLAVQRLSDMVCLEHGLSIITPKPYRERQKRTVYPKKRTQRDELCDAIDAVLKQKPKSFDGFVQALADMGFEFKDGKQPAFKGENQKRFIRLRSLGEGYSKEEIQAVISGKNLHKSKGGSAKAPAPKQFQMLIDIQAKMAEGKTVGYEKWAKKFNRKEAARTVILLKEKGLGNYDDLTAHIENLPARFDALSDSIKAAEKRMVEVQALQQHIKNYRNTRQIYIEYRKSGYSKKFFEEHRQEITIHKAAKQAFDELQITKLPSMQSLYEEFHQLAVQKKQDYAEYRQIRKEKEELLIAKRTVETILNIDRQKEQEKADDTIRQYLYLSEIREMEVKKLMEREQYDEAVRLLDEGIELSKKEEYDGTTGKWLKLKLKIFERTNRTSEVIDTCRLLFISGREQLEYYHKLKTLIPKEQWKVFLDEMMKEVPFNGYFSFDRNVEAEIYVEEKEDERLFHLLSSAGFGQLEALMQYAHHLKNSHSEQLIDMYISILIDYAERNIGRKYYEQIARALLCMQELNGGKVAVKQLVEDFRTIYKRRSAMMEELRRF